MQRRYLHSGVPAPAVVAAVQSPRQAVCYSSPHLRMKTCRFLFAGFMSPRPATPEWWRWVIYLCPPSWAIYALVADQLGDKVRPLVPCHNRYSAYAESCTVLRA